MPTPLIQFTTNDYAKLNFMQDNQQQIKSTPIRKNLDFGLPRDSFFLVRWLSLYSLIQLGRSLLRPLRKTDFFNLTEDIYPSTNYRKFEQVKQSMPNKANNIISTMFYKVLIWDFLLAGLLAIVTAALSFSGPLVIERTLDFLNNPQATIQQQNIAYNYAALWIGLFLLRIFINAYCQRVLTYTGMKAEQILTIQLLLKMQKLAPSYRFNTDKDRSQLLTILTANVAAVVTFLTTSTILFSAPATLIGVQVFLFIKVGIYGFVLIVILAIAGVVQAILHKKILSAKRQKVAVMSKRIITNLEMFHSMQSLKLFGWEKLVVEKNMTYRQVENHFNKRCDIYLNIFDLVISLVPVLTVLLIFVLLIVTKADMALQTTLVYTVLSFVGLTYIPVKSLLNAITNAIAGIAAMKQISTFMKADEMLGTMTQDNTTERGTLQINNLVAAWTPYQRKRKEQSQPKHKQTVNQSLQKPLLNDQGNQPQEDKLIKYEQVRAALKFAFGVPMSIKLKKGERLILISKPQAGKSTFFQMLIGNLHILSGMVKFSGSIGYLPQNLWFRKTSMRDNVLFGLPLIKKKLNFVYTMVLLKEELGFFRNGDKIIMEQNNGMSDGQRRRIALARVLYAEPDLLLLDEVFASIDPETTHAIYNNLCKHYSDKTIVLSTHVTNFVRSEDKLMILKDGVVMQFGTLEELSTTSPNPQRNILQFRNDYTQNQKKWFAEQDQVRTVQLEQKKKRMSQLRLKLRAFIHNIVNITKGLSREQIEERIFKEAERRKKLKEEAADEAVRVQSVKWQNYYKFFRTAPRGCHLLLFALSLLSQSSKIFSDWWIGSVGNLPWSIDDRSAMYVYIGLTAVFGVILAIQGFISPAISKVSARNLNTLLCKSLAYADFRWYSETNSLKVAELANRDDAQIYAINTTIQTLFRDVLTFLATVVLVGITSPLFLVIAVAAIIIHVNIFHVYRRAKRQFAIFQDNYSTPLVRTYEQIIHGIDLLRAFGKMSNPKQAILEQYYNWTVYKINCKFLDMGMSILTEIVSLGIIAGAAFFAVRSKFASQQIQSQDIAIIGTSITFAMKITGLVTGVNWSITAIENGINDNIVTAYSIITKHQQYDYFTPKPPNEWPANGSIQFDNVTLRCPWFLDTSVSDVRLTINSGERVYLTGKSGSGKGSLMKAVAKYLRPVKNTDRTMGVLKVGGLDIQQIGRKWLTQHVMLLNAVPFMFTASLRENIDPFKNYTDTKIIQCLQMSGAWKLLGTVWSLDQEGKEGVEMKLKQIIVNAGYFMSLGLLQQINISRAFLHRPKIILWDAAASSLDEATQIAILESLKRTLPNTTMMVISQKVTTAMEMDKVVYMSNGRVKEHGPPRTLLKKKQSNPFAKMVKNSQSDQVLKILKTVEDEPDQMGVM